MVEAVTIGEPEAMRALARQLQTIAADLRPSQFAARSALATTEFSGPAAGRVRAAASDAAQQAERAIAELDALAVSLLADAGKVQDENDRLRREAEQAAQAAAEGAEDGRVADDRPVIDAPVEIVKPRGNG